MRNDKPDLRNLSCISGETDKSEWFDPSCRHVGTITRTHHALGEGCGECSVLVVVVAEHLINDRGGIVVGVGGVARFDVIFHETTQDRAVDGAVTIGLRHLAHRASLTSPDYLHVDAIVIEKHEFIGNGIGDGVLGIELFLGDDLDLPADIIVVDETSDGSFLFLPHFGVGLTVVATCAAEEGQCSQDDS